MATNGNNFLKKHPDIENTKSYNLIEVWISITGLIATLLPDEQKSLAKVIAKLCDAELHLRDRKNGILPITKK